MVRFPSRGSARLAGVGVVVGLSVSCAPEFDTARVASPQGTVGEEVFRVMCERVHTGETPTDVTFERGRAPCTRGLAESSPAPRGVGPRTVALGRMRSGLTGALDAAMPRDTYTPLDRLLVALLPLYGPDGSRRTDAMRRPVVNTPDGGVTFAEDLLPQTTRAVSRLVNTIAASDDARAALARMSLRRGYRPPTVAFGVLRPVLAYDRVDDVLDTTFRMFRDATMVAPAGPSNAQFNTMLSVMRGEFSDAAPATAAQSVGGTTLDATLDLVLRTDDALANGQPVEVVRRNACGFAQLEGPVAAPFVDSNSDGAVDTVRCAPVDAQRRPLRDAPTPFLTAGAAATPRDAAGRATVTAGGALRYQFARLDTSMLGAVMRQLPPLMQGADPPAFQLMVGMQPMLGARADATKMYSSGPVAYRQFTMEGSPLVDLLHGAGVLLTHRDAPVALDLARQLMTGARNEQTTARLMGAALAVDAIADRFPAVTMPAESVVWDDVMAVARRIAAEPGLLEEVLDAVAEMTRPLPEAGLWQPQCRGTVPMENLARAFSAYMRHRDRVEPDWNDSTQVDGFAAWNRPVNVMLQRTVDRARPDTQDWQNPGAAADNRSTMGRIFHLVDDLNGARMCNKQNAAVRIYFRIPLIGTETSIPVPGASDIPSCSLVEIPDAATFFLRTVVGGGRAVMPMSLPGLAGAVTDISRRFGLNLDPTLDNLVQSQSGIRGFNSQPTPFGVARLVFQPRPNAFVTGLMDPVVIRNGDGAASQAQYHVRNYHRGTLFAWESYCFYDSVRPIAAAFVRHDRDASGRLDPTLRPGQNPAEMAPRNIDTSRGSKLFAELFVAFHRHWATATSGDFQSGTRCATCAAGRNFAYLDGASRYEPIVQEALDGDLMGALGAATVTLRDLRPQPDAMCDRRRNGTRTACTGVDVFAGLVRALVMPDAPALDGRPAYASAPANRAGSTRALWSDGTTPTDTTVFTLFADAFNAMDPLLARDPAQRAAWESARSALVDQLMTVEGTGASARMRNGAMAPITRMLMAWAIDRLAAHRAAGDLEAWARDPAAGLSARLRDTMRGPGVASALDLGLAIQGDRDARATMSTLLRHMLADTTVGDAQRHGTNFATTLSAVADLLQFARADQDIDPFLRVLAPALEPRTGTAALALRFLDRARGYDPDRVLSRVLANVTRRPSGGDALAPEPLTVIADGVADTNRQTPGDRGPMSEQDFAVMLRALADFFSDDRRGMEQFYSIVQQRRLPQ